MNHTATATAPAPAGFLSRLLGGLFSRRADPREALRPLWHGVVASARRPDWYTSCGIADSLPGRFDAITLVLALVLLRLETEAGQTEAGVRLTELFVEDMDGQLREAGVGDLVVGKHIGRLMSVLGGRLGAYRAGLAEADDAELHAALTRNVTLTEGSAPQALAAATRQLATALAALPAERLLAGEMPA